MAAEKIKLGNPETLPSGKVRWQKMYKKQKWKSLAFENDSRRNRQNAWQDFREWRDQIDRQLAYDQEKQQQQRPFLNQFNLTNVEVVAEAYEHENDRSTAAKLREIASKIENSNDVDLQNLLAQFFMQKSGTIEAMEAINHSHRQAQKNQPTETVTCGELAEQYFAIYQQRAEAKQIAMGRFGVVKAHIRKFVNWWGSDRPLEHFTKEDVKEYYLHCMAMIGKPLKQNTVADAHAEFKKFIEQMAEDGHCEFPANIRSRQYRIPRVDKEPQPFPIDEIPIVLKTAIEKTRLYLLLMLNCGMYQSDVADLKATEVDWEQGRIIRKRTKRKNAQKHKSTNKQEKNRKVNWLLWDETFALLKKYGNREGLVLTNAKNEPLIKEWIEKGESKKTDNIHSAYWRVVRRLRKDHFSKDWKRDMMTLRKVGANIMQQSELYAEFVAMFLDHSSVANRAYLVGGVAVPKFDAAIRYVGDKLGQATKRKL